MYRYNKSEKFARPPLASKRLLDQVRERIRYLHYSLKTEKAYLYWVRLFVLWSARQGGMRHPKEMGAGPVPWMCWPGIAEQRSGAWHRHVSVVAPPFSPWRLMCSKNSRMHKINALICIKNDHL